MAGKSAWKRVRRGDGRTVFHHKSEKLGDTLEITIVPPVRPPKRRRAPVLYVLDPFLTLDTVVGWTRVYERYSEGNVPGAFIVGIGYPTDDEDDFLYRRIRDLTPTANSNPGWTPPLGAGQGTLFLDTIENDIVPFVEAHFPASRDRTIVGWSLGGLFALQALFERPKLFSRYLVVSPSLWWDERLPFAWESDWAKTHDDLAARIFLCVGAKEEAPGGGWLSEGFDDEVLAWFRQVTNFRRFTRRLKSRRYPKLRLDATIFPDEFHMTVYPAAIARGLVRLFAK